MSNYYDDNDIRPGDHVVKGNTNYIVAKVGGQGPTLLVINACPDFLCGSRGPEFSAYAHSPEMPLPRYPSGERPAYKLLERITLYLSSAHDVQIGDLFFPYHRDDESYGVVATSEVRLGLLQIVGELQ